jgi:hypothetical protein
MSKQVKLGDPFLVVSMTCDQDDLPVRGNALASGDDEEDKKAEEAILRDIESGNEWAWCTAHVRVTYKGILTADDYLGACSYPSEDDFRDGGYFDDMVSSCVAEINNQLSRLAE